MEERIAGLAASSPAELHQLLKSFDPARTERAHGTGPVRVSILYSSAVEWKSRKELALQQLTQSHAGIREQTSALSVDAPGVFLSRHGMAEPVLAFLYPGQGSQKPGMLQTLRNAVPAFDCHLRRLDRTVISVGGTSLLHLLDHDDSSGRQGAVLRDTRNAQPLMGIFSTALRLTLEDLGISARFHAGHSYGELPALCGAGVMDEVSLLRLSVERGRLLHQAALENPGGMLAILAPVELVRALLHRLALASLVIANENSPQQVVVAGADAELATLQELCKREGLRCSRLNTSAAFHSGLMMPALRPWTEVVECWMPLALATGNPGAAFCNETGEPYRSVEEIALGVAHQIVRPVRWRDVCLQLEQRGANVLLELGPGQTLTDLTKQSLRNPDSVWADSIDSGAREAGHHWLSLLATLYARGVNVHLHQLARPEPFAAEVHLNSETHRQPFPVGAHVLASNESLLEKFFSQQRGLLELALQSGEPEHRPALVKAAMAANQSVLSEVLATQEAVARLMLGMPEEARDTVGVLSRRADITPPPSVRASEPQGATDRHSLVQRVVDALRSEIVRTTGFPAAAVTESIRFTDLGLDSLSMADIWSRLLTQMPELAEQSDAVFEIHCLADVALLAQQPSDSVVVTEDVFAPLASPQPPVTSVSAVSVLEEPSAAAAFRWSHLRVELLQMLSATSGVALDALTSSTHFETDLHLDVLTRGEIFDALLREYPRFAHVGRELLNVQTLGELDRLMDRFDPVSEDTLLVEENPLINAPETAASVAQVVQRYRVGEAALSVSERAELGTARALPRRVLLIGESGTSSFVRMRRALERVHVETRVVDLAPGGWNAGAVSLSLDSHEALGDLLASENAFGADGLVFVTPSSAHVDASAEYPLLALFSLAKGLWGDHEDAMTPDSFVVLTGDWNRPPDLGVRGLVRSLRREISGVAFRTVHMTDGLKQGRARLLLEAMYGPSPAADLTVRDGELWTPALTPERAGSRATVALNSASRVLVLGGGDGIAAELAIALASRFGCEIVAIGRTPWDGELPYPETGFEPPAVEELKRSIFEEFTRQGRSPEQLHSAWAAIARQRALWRTCRRVQSAGGRFQYVQADAAQEPSLRAAIESVLAAGPLHGVIHGAGMIRDHLLGRKSISEFRSVLLPKLTAAHVLQELCATQPLEFACFLSSMTAVTGTAGQTDYAAANEALNNMATEWNRHVSYPVKSLLWSVWTETGMATESLKRQMMRLSLDGIPTADGVECFLQELLGGSKQEPTVLFAPPSTLRFAMDASAPAVRSQASRPARGSAARELAAGGFDASGGMTLTAGSISLVTTV